MDKKYKLAAGLTGADFAEMTAISAAMKNIDPAHLGLFSDKVADQRDLLKQYGDRIDPEVFAIAGKTAAAMTSISEVMKNVDPAHLGMLSNKVADQRDLLKQYGDRNDPEHFANAEKTAAERTLNDLKMAVGVQSQKNIERLLNPWQVGNEQRAGDLFPFVNGIDGKTFASATEKIDADTLAQMKEASDHKWEHQDVFIPPPPDFDHHFREVKRRDAREEEKLELARRAAEASEGVLATALQQATDAKLEAKAAKRETKKAYAIAAVGAFGTVAGLAIAAWPFVKEWLGP